MKKGWIAIALSLGCSHERVGRPAIDPHTHSATPPPSWTACDADERCVIVGVGCCYVMAVEKDVQERAQASLRAAPAVEEGGCIGACEWKTQCSEHRCILIR